MTQEKELEKINRLLTKAHGLLMAFNTGTTRNHAEQIDAICDDLEKYIKEIKTQGKIKK